MKVLIVDRLSPDTVTELQKLKLEVEVRGDLTADTLPTALADVHILVVRSTKVTAAAIQAAPQLSLIIRAGAGVDTIDLASASARGVYVANCPGKNTAAVAELAIGLMIAADRRIVDATVAMRNGKWQKKEFGKSRGLMGRTLGVLGYGAIGRAVAQRAAGLGMKVVTWEIMAPQVAKQDGIECIATPEALAAMSDVRNQAQGQQKIPRRHEAGRDFGQRLARRDCRYPSTAAGRQGKRTARRHGRV
jgi:D-3-phosphoglycerate dehydrogenase